MADLSSKISELRAKRDLIRTIHYGCESWFYVKDRPVAISCIAIHDARSGETRILSLTDYENHSEEQLLIDYYAYIRETPEARYIHWNINSSDYGFSAIDKRFKYLTGKDAPYRISEERRYDLDDLISYESGALYVDHPKLRNLGFLNDFPDRYILSGKEEADKFPEKEFGDIKRSVTEKTKLIAHLTERFIDGMLQTKTSGPRVNFAGEKIDAVKTVIEIGGKFRAVSRQLIHRHDKRETLKVNDEYDAQDLFHALLRLFFDDVREEEWVPRYAGSNKRTDFLVPAHAMAVELKYTRPGLNGKELGNQLVIDTENYKQHPGVRILVSLVFDYDGYLVNPVGIENDLTFVRDGYSVVTRIFN